MTKKLETRCWRLKDYLEQHFESGKFITIEEICEAMPEYYTLNTNPYNHDKCAVLSNDVRQINWNVCEGQKIIVKDTKGNIKLCESEEEFNAWREHELKPLQKKWMYLNNLKYKVARDGEMPLLNQNLNENKDKDGNLKEINTFMKGQNE